MSSPSLDDLLRQQRELDAQIASLKTARRKAALAEIRDLMSVHGLAPKDVGLGGPKVKESPERAARPPVPPKYRDQAGHTWSGRGLKPKWLVAAIAAGKSARDFLISE
jgi:DNA-binding protein H-NS